MLKVPNLTPLLKSLAATYRSLSEKTFGWLFSTIFNSGFFFYKKKTGFGSSFLQCKSDTEMLTISFCCILPHLKLILRL